MARQSIQKPVEGDQNLPAIYSRLEEKKKAFTLALAGDAPIDKFVRSIHLSLQKDPKLLQCNPLSLIDACEKAANDGLLLDGRQAALVVFGSVAQYLPMYQGLMFRAYRSGMIDSWNVHVVYENELKVDPELGRPRFQHIIDGVERIIHMPMYSDLGKPVLVYSAVKLRGSTSMNYDVMTIARVVEIASARSGGLTGLWSGKHKLEMAKKTVIRHHCKYLPSDARLSSTITHLDEAEQQQEELMTLEEEPRPARKRTGEASRRLTPTLEEQQAFGKKVEEPFDADTGEVVEDEEEQPFTEELF